MNKYLLVILIVCEAVSVSGQDSTKTSVCDSTLTVSNLNKPYGQYHHIYAVAGKEITKEQAAIRLNLFKSSGEEYQLYKKSRKASIVSLAVGIPLLIAGNIYAHHEGASSGALIGGSIAFVYTMQIPGFNMMKHFRRSVNLYNREICRR